MQELTLIEKAFFLKKTQLFAELDLDLTLAIANKAEQRNLKAHELIFSSNQDAHCLYIIVSGKVAIIDDDDRLLTTLTTTDFFGDEALFNREPRGYTAKTYSDAKLLLISRSHLIEIMLECPQVAIAMVREYANLTTFRKRKLGVTDL